MKKNIISLLWLGTGCLWLFASSQLTVNKILIGLVAIVSGVLYYFGKFK